jgi:hypothetical protein
MGTISELFNLVSLGNEAQRKLKADPDNIKTMSTLFAKAKSISAQASKYVMEYPVACTTAISDFSTALAITKQVEFDCARFIILASGLNPIIRTGSGDTIEAHINSLISSYESYSGIKVSIKPAIPEHEMASMEYMNKYYSTEAYEIYNTNTDTTHTYSSEAQPPFDNTNVVYEDPDGKGYKRRIDNYFNSNQVHPGDTPDYDTIIGPEPTNSTVDHDEWVKAKSYIDGFYENNTNKTFIRDASLFTDLNGKLGKIAPTIITLNLFIQDGNGVDRQIQLPLAIKASLQYVDTMDIRNMLANVDVPGKKLLNFFKMTTGQISFFKDWLLALDSAKGDVERERTIGHTPFFRSLMNNKSKWRFKTIFGAVPFIKNFVAAKTQKDLPMCTLIIDESEVHVLGFRLSDMVKNRAKYVDRILDQYMLLGLGIVDKDNEVIYFFYSGEDHPVIADIKDVGSNGKDTKISDDLAKALANMSKLITKH